MKIENKIEITAEQTKNILKKTKHGATILKKTIRSSSRAAIVMRSANLAHERIKLLKDKVSNILYDCFNN